MDGTSPTQAEVFSFPLRTPMCRPAYVVMVFAQGLGILIPCLLIPPLPAGAYVPLMFGASIGFLALGFYVYHRCERAVRGCQVCVNESSFTLKKNSEVVWSIAWSDFGGYRKNDPGLIYETKNPGSYGIDVLDRSNRVVGVLPLLPSLSNDRKGPSIMVDRAFRKALFAAMDARLQPPFAPYENQLEIPFAHSPKRIIVSLAVGFAALVVAVLQVMPYFASANSGEVLPGWMLSPKMIVLAIATWGVAIWGLVAGVHGLGYRLLRLRRGPVRRLGNLTDEDLVLMKSADRPVDLVNGTYEVKLDKKRLQDLNGNAAVVGILCIVMSGLLVFFVLPTSELAVLAVVIGLLVLLLTPLLLLAMISYGVVRSQGHRLTLAGDELTVTKPDGRSTQYQKWPRRARLSRVVETLFEVRLWSAGRSIYVVSPRDVDRLS